MSTTHSRTVDLPASAPQPPEIPKDRTSRPRTFAAGDAVAVQAKHPIIAACLRPGKGVRDRHWVGWRDHFRTVPRLLSRAPSSASEPAVAPAPPVTLRARKCGRLYLAVPGNRRSREMSRCPNMRSIIRSVPRFGGCRTHVRVESESRVLVGPQPVGLLLLYCRWLGHDLVQVDLPFLRRRREAPLYSCLHAGHEDVVSKLLPAFF
jgi:hypothetical protein